MIEGVGGCHWQQWVSQEGAPVGKTGSMVVCGPSLCDRQERPPAFILAGRHDGISSSHCKTLVHDTSELQWGQKKGWTLLEAAQNTTGWTCSWVPEGTNWTLISNPEPFITAEFR